LALAYGKIGSIVAVWAKHSGACRMLGARRIHRPRKAAVSMRQEAARNFRRVDIISLHYRFTRKTRVSLRATFGRMKQTGLLVNPTARADREGRVEER